MGFESGIKSGLESRPETGVHGDLRNEAGELGRETLIDSISKHLSTTKFVIGDPKFLV